MAARRQGRLPGGGFCRFGGSAWPRALRGAHGGAARNADGAERFALGSDRDRPTKSGVEGRRESAASARSKCPCRMLPRPSNAARTANPRPPSSTPSSKRWRSFASLTLPPSGNGRVTRVRAGRRCNARPTGALQREGLAPRPGGAALKSRSYLARRRPVFCSDPCRDHRGRRCHQGGACRQRALGRPGLSRDRRQRSQCGPACLPACASRRDVSGNPRSRVKSRPERRPALPVGSCPGQGRSRATRNPARLE